MNDHNMIFDEWWKTFPIPGEYDMMDSCDQSRWRGVAIAAFWAGMTAEREALAKAEEEARAAKVFEAARIKADQDLMPTVKTMAEDRATMEAQIEERRKQAQNAEQSHPFSTKPNDSRDYVEHDFGFPQPNAPAKRVRPDDKEIIEAVQAAFGVSYGTSCDWILEVAENLEGSP